MWRKKTNMKKTGGKSAQLKHYHIWGKWNPFHLWTSSKNNSSLINVTKSNFQNMWLNMRMWQSWCKQLQVIRMRCSMDFFPPQNMLKMCSKWVKNVLKMYSVVIVELMPYYKVNINSTAFDLILKWNISRTLIRPINQYLFRKVHSKVIWNQL